MKEKASEKQRRYCLTVILCKNKNYFTAEKKIVSRPSVFWLQDFDMSLAPGRPVPPWMIHLLQRVLRHFSFRRLVELCPCSRRPAEVVPKIFCFLTFLKGPFKDLFRGFLKFFCSFTKRPVF